MELIKIETFDVSRKSLKNNLLEYYQKNKIDGFFGELKTYGLNTESFKKSPVNKSVKKVSFDVHKMVPGQDGDYLKIFSTINNDLTKLALSEDQVVDLLFNPWVDFEKIRQVADSRNRIIHCLIQKETPEGEDKEFFVYADGLDYPVNPLKNKFVRRGVREHIFIVPRQE